MATFADFYGTDTEASHGSEYCAFYMGRNSVWYDLPFTAASAFKTKGDFDAYCRGRRSAQAEERLDADTEWNGDEGWA